MKAGLSEILPGMVAAAVLGIVLLTLLFLYEICRWHWQAWRTKRAAMISPKQDVTGGEVPRMGKVPCAGAPEVASLDIQTAQDHVVVKTFGTQDKTRIEESASLEEEPVDEDALETQDFTEDQPPEDAVVQPFEETAGRDREARRRRREERGSEGDRKSRKRIQVHTEEPANADNNEARERRGNKRRA